MYILFYQIIIYVDNTIGIKAAIAFRKSIEVLHNLKYLNIKDCIIKKETDESSYISIYILLTHIM